MLLRTGSDAKDKTPINHPPLIVPLGVYRLYACRIGGTYTLTRTPGYAAQMRLSEKQSKSWIRLAPLGQLGIPGKNRKIRSEEWSAGPFGRNTPD